MRVCHEGGLLSGNFTVLTAELNVLQLPSDDVKDILEQMSTHSSKGWKFVFDYDRDFVDRSVLTPYKEKQWNCYIGFNKNISDVCFLFFIFLDKLSQHEVGFYIECLV